MNEVLKDHLTSPLDQAIAYMISQVALNSLGYPQLPVIVAFSAFIHCVVSWRMFQLLPLAVWDHQDASTYRGIVLGVLFQMILLFASEHSMVSGSIHTCIIWIGCAATVCLFMIYAWFIALFKGWRWIEASKFRLQSWGILLLVPTAMIYVLVCMQRNAITEYYGTAEPGAFWERRAYDTNVEIEIIEKSDAILHANALAHVVSRGGFWERFRGIDIESFSFTEKDRHHIKLQHDTLEPKYDRMQSYVTTTKGLEYLIQLSKNERERFQR
jgi:hypothetical protein